MPVSPPIQSMVATLAALVDTLLPGDDLFPPASAAGSHGLVYDRLRLLHGPEHVDELVAFLNSGEQPFAQLPAEERARAVQRLERERPAWFESLRFATYLSYYQAPPVIRAIRALGHEYNEAPQPRGYALPPFDPTPGGDVPREPRGAYLRTEAVARVDLRGLADILGEGGRP